MTRDELEARKQQPSNVPCGGCRACCRHDAIMLTPKDDLSQYKWHLAGGVPVLDRKPNGECIYLTPAGCGIHGRAPDICRRFDCRILYLTTDKATRRARIQVNPTMRKVYDAGKLRQYTLEDHGRSD